MDLTFPITSLPLADWTPDVVVSGQDRTGQSFICWAARGQVRVGTLCDAKHVDSVQGYLKVALKEMERLVPNVRDRFLSCPSHSSHTSACNRLQVPRTTCANVQLVVKWRSFEKHVRGRSVKMLCVKLPCSTLLK